jgi:hypothetical protein
MTHRENTIDDIFDNMVKTGMLSTSNRWIEKAAEQKNPKLTLDLACSHLLVYDRVDLMLIALGRLN